MKLENLEQIIEEINKRCKPDDTNILPDLEKSVEENQLKRQRIIKLHLKDLIDEQELETELKRLKSEKRELKRAYNQAAADRKGFKISKADIKRTIENLSEEIKYAPPDKLRMVFNNLYQEIEIFPKNQNLQQAVY